MNISIRQVTPDDAYDIRRIQAEGWHDNNLSPSTGITTEFLQNVKGLALPPTPEKVAQMRELLSNDILGKKNLGWVAVDSGKVVGWVSEHATEGEEIELGIYIDREHRNRGVGGLLMDEVMRTHSTKKLTLMVTKTNIKAQRFYEKYGFHPVREHKHYMKDDTHVYLPVIIMKNF
jgi:ribosomal protein S18 acetylase RimI-like enzyme